jgi:hypothetical protein
LERVHEITKRMKKKRVAMWKPDHPLLQDLVDKALLYKADQGFHEVLEPSWNEPSDSTCERECEKDQKTGNPHRNHSIGNGNVNAANF